MPRKQYDLIVFDWDGTLMDSTSAIVKCIQGAAKDLGLPIPHEDAASHVIGLSLHEAMQVVMPGVEPHFHTKMVERYRVHFLSRDHELELFKGVPAMLEELKSAGYFLAVATGKSRVGLNRAMNAVGVLSLFDATRCADETFSKPHPAMLQEITRELGQDLKRTVMIGDTTHDLQMALNAGCAAVGVSYGAHEPSGFDVLKPRFVAHTVAELHGWLLEHA